MFKIETTQSYKEACKLWLWYHYQCEKYDSQICTGIHPLIEYLPITNQERELSYKNARENMNIINQKRKILLLECGIEITKEEWLSAKMYYSRYKLKALEEEYNHVFKDLIKDKIDTKIKEE